MAVVVWIALLVAYVWSVRNLGLMSRSPDPWSPTDVSERIDHVRTDETLPGGMVSAKRQPVVISLKRQAL
jgi:hypothetical protein